jgi:fatty-acyl-CoA synthase
MTDFTGPPAEGERGIGALTMGGLLQEVAARYGSREALCFRQPDGTVLRWTYDELLARSRRFAKALVATGADKGTRVALLMGNRPEWVEVAFGTALAGAVLVPVNTLFEPPEIEHVLAHSDCAVVVCQEQLAHHRYHDQVLAMERELPYLRTVVCVGTDSYDTFVDAGGAGGAGGARGARRARGAGGATDDATLDARAAGVSPYDDALIVYTSGSTGMPKGVIHAHRAPALQSWRFVEHLRVDQRQRVWSAFPFFWTAGFCMVMGGTLAAGGCLVLQELFDAGEALDLLETERVSQPHAWPHQLAALESHPTFLSRDLSAVTHTDSFSAIGRHPSVKVEEDSWSPRAAYGLTETFTIVTSTPADTPAAEREGHEGAILPGNTIRIVDAETGETQPAWSPGEIRVKGPTLMKGYVKVAPEDVFDADGFFATGDAGFVDAAGRLHWVGRTSDLIKTGGANVSPVEIENELLRHPGLATALAVGVPHPLLGEMVVVCAVAQPGSGVDEPGVREFLRGKLASYKLPRRVLFFAEDELVLTGNAKIRADELRRLATERLARSENAF